MGVSKSAISPALFIGSLIEQIINVISRSFRNNPVRVFSFFPYFDHRENPTILCKTLS